MCGLLVRAAIVRIVDHDDATIVIGPRGTRRYDGDSATLVREVLALYARPLAREALYAELEQQAGGEFPRDPVDELCRLLVVDGVLVTPREAAPAVVARRVVLAITGAIARIATGDCSELVAALVCATRAPVVIAPSMNDGMYASPAVQANLATLRGHGRWVVHPSLGAEVATPPGERRPLLGMAPPAPALVDIVRYVLAQLPPRPALPRDAAGWEQLWATTPTERLAWHAHDVDAALAAALDARHAPGRSLLDLGTGAGTVAIATARRGFTVTATDIAPTALGRARARAGALPILFALDDVTAPRVFGPFDVAVDCGLLHCLPPDARGAYAASLSRLVAIA